jgi:F0F1-type ATP synthase membrane subunit a
MPFCQKCGSRMEQTDSFCKSCGTPIGVQANQTHQHQASPVQRSTARKSKIVSILLAVFLTFFTWLYTFKRDGWKFWLGLVFSSLPGLVSAIFLVFYISDISWLPDDLLIGLSYLLPMAIWLWAIIDAAIKKHEWYEHY